MDSDAAIVADLAACEELTYIDVDANYVCVLCAAWADDENITHEPGCPWLRARQRRGMTV